MRVTDSSFLLYLQQINAIPLLSRKEEKAIALKVCSGDEDAKRKLVAANLKFVVKIAKRYANKGVTLSDLISEGNLGLIRATETFDPERGYHFISYAVHWIKQSIIKCIAEKARPVRMPLSWNNNLIKLSRYFNHTGNYNLSPAKIKILAKELQIKESDILPLIQLAQNSISLDQDIYSGVSEENLQIKNTLKNENSVSPEEELNKKQLKDQLATNLNKLKPIEKDILERRFAIGKFTSTQTLLTIGKEYKLTKERVRQIERKALDTLRQKLSETGVSSPVYY